jgi:2-oxoglutarate ferredoxin oxidoreductase subunit beta
LVKEAQKSDEYWAKYATGRVKEEDKYPITREELKGLYPYDVEIPLKKWKNL